MPTCPLRIRFGDVWELYLPRRAEGAVVGQARNVYPIPPVPLAPLPQGWTFA